jgi:hypothetical protein
MHREDFSAAAFVAALNGGRGCAARNILMQVFSADRNAGDLMLMVGGSEAPRMEIEDPAGAGPPGSGNWGTPWPRMHVANVTAPGPGPEPVWADALGPPPPPHAASASAAAPAAGASADLQRRMAPLYGTVANGDVTPLCARYAYPRSG